MFARFSRVADRSGIPIIPANCNCAEAVEIAFRRQSFFSGQAVDLIVIRNDGFQSTRAFVMYEAPGARPRHL